MSEAYKGITGSEEPNYSPLRPLEQAADKSPRLDPDFEKWLCSFTQKLFDRNKETWDAKALDAQANELFYQGYQRLRRATYGAYWRPLEQKPVHYTINSFRFWSDLITSKWLASTTDYDIATANDTIEAASGGRVAEKIADHYAGKFYTQIFRTLEAKRAQFEGNFARYVYYNPHLPVKARVPVVEEVEMQLGTGAGLCGECGYSGEESEFFPQEGDGAAVLPDSGAIQGPESAEMPGLGEGEPIEGPEPDETIGHEAAELPEMAGPAPMCPNCGSSIVQMTPVEPVTVNQVTGYEEKQVGDLDVQSPSIYNLRYDVTSGLEASNYLIWDEWIDREVADALYPGIKKPNDTDGSVQATVREALERHSVAAGSRDTAREDRVKLRRVWLRPCMYANYKLPADTETTAGPIPAGTKLAEMFPSGLYIAMIGELVVDLREENKDEHWCGTGYFLLPTSGLHDGISDMREPQRQLNTGKSLLNLWMRHQASPATLINTLLVDPAEWSGEPHKAVPIKHENLGLIEGMDISKAIFPITGSPFPAGIMAYGSELKNDLQLAAHATDFSGGLPGVNNSTATGAQIAQSLAQSIHTTQLAQRAYVDARTAELTLKLFRKYCWDERWVQLKGDYGDLDGEYFTAADIDFDFKVEPVMDSWLPRTKQQRQENLEKALMVLGSAGGFAMAPPALIAEIADTYGVDFGDEKFSQSVRVARARINQMRTNLPGLMPMIQALPPSEITQDPMTGEMVEVPIDPMAELGALLVQTLQPALNPREIGMEEAINYLRAWYLTDEGRESPPELIAGVNALIDQMFMMAGQVQGMIAAQGAQVQMAGMPPMPPGGPEGESPSSGAGKPKKTEQDRRNDSARANFDPKQAAGVAP